MTMTTFISHNHEGKTYMKLDNNTDKHCYAGRLYNYGANTTLEGMQPHLGSKS